MSYYLYVIELDKQVGKIKKFRKQSPNFIFGNRCFYVGQSAKAPMLRFKQHMELDESWYKNLASYLHRKVHPKGYNKLLSIYIEKVKKSWAGVSTKLKTNLPIE